MWHLQIISKYDDEILIDRWRETKAELEEEAGMYVSELNSYRYDVKIEEEFDVID